MKNSLWMLRKTAVWVDEELLVRLLNPKENGGFVEGKDY